MVPPKPILVVCILSQITIRVMSQDPLSNDDLSSMVSLCRQTSWNPTSPECASMPFWDTSAVTSMSRLFQNDAEFNLDISRWDTGNVRDMSFTFAGASVFNGNITHWDTSSVTTMEGMFALAAAFNQNLSRWDTSSVTDLELTFQQATSFNGDVSTWNVASVTSMLGTFLGAEVFNNDISRWDVSSVQNTIIMFWLASSFNVDLCPWTDRLNLPTTCHPSCDSDMLEGTPKLSMCDVNECRDATSNACGQGSIFALCTDGDSCGLSTVCTNLDGGEGSFNCSARPTLTNEELQSRVELCRTAEWDVSTPECADMPFWDTSAVTSMSGLFEGNGYLNSDISGWDTSRVTDMSRMFSFSLEFSYDLSPWNTSSVRNMEAMFENCRHYNGDLSGWDVSRVENMARMFQYARAYNRDLSEWDTSSVTTMTQMFRSAESFNANISTWDTSQVTEMRWMFDDAFVFNSDIAKWNTGNVENMEQMFAGTMLFNSDIGSWNTSGVSSMRLMFYQAESFNFDISRWDVGSVTDMLLMFWQAAAFNVDLCPWTTMLRPEVDAMRIFFSTPKLSFCDVNECLSNNPCSTSAACANTDGSFTCECNAGFESVDSGITCVPGVDECADDLDNCDQHATCSNLLNLNRMGNYSCWCNSGYTGDGFSCADIDECILGTHTCSVNAVCNNFGGGFNCSCLPGYNGSGAICIDTDECSLPTSPCSINGTCTNTEGSFACECFDGFESEDGGATCVPGVDECEGGLHTCGANATCTNTYGSFMCRCHDGYESVDGGVTCVSGVDECEYGVHDCDGNATCVNTLGSFTCACNGGYETIDNGVTCVSGVDECRDGVDDCDENAICTNTLGSFTCGCALGFSEEAIQVDDYSPSAFYCYSTGSLVSTCAGCDNCASPENVLDGDDNTIWNPAGLGNADTAYLTFNFGTAREVLGVLWTQFGDGTHDRSVLEVWNSTDGVTFEMLLSASLQTGQAIVETVLLPQPPSSQYLRLYPKSGPFQPWVKTVDFLFSTVPACLDINECIAGDSTCSSNAHCSNTEGSFSCTCNTGYNGDGMLCEDVDECARNTDNCDDANAACMNTVGSFECACNAGYNGTGVACFEVHECNLELDTCGPDATCSNTDGSFSCACNSGYTGDGVTCTNVDECSAGSYTCHAQAMCTDTVGSFECVCLEGFVASCPGYLFPAATLANGAQWTASSEAGCTECESPEVITLDGVNDHVELGNLEFPGGDVTYSARIKAVTANRWSRVFDFGNGQSSSNHVLAFQGTTGQLTFHSYQGTSNAANPPESPSALPLNQWLHVAVTVSGTTASLYVDGLLIDTGGANGVNTALSSNYIGRSNWATDEYFQGNIADFLVFGRALSDEEISLLNSGGFQTGDDLLPLFNCSSSKNPVCADVDECITSDPCTANALCTNTAGSFMCTCSPGYSGDGISCANDDECSLGTHNCHVQAKCTDTTGSFSCACNAGWESVDDGVTCADALECGVIDNCHPDAVCTDANGSFTCTCPDGHLDVQGDGTLCDLDECSQDEPVCDGNSTCKNTLGSFVCECDDWFGMPNKTVYHFDFEGGEDLSAWSATSISVANQLGSFLGRFHTGEPEVTLNLTALNLHTELIIDFDFLRLDSWDNEPFSVSVDGEEVFRNSFQFADNACAVAAHSVFDSRWGDAVYHFRISVPHAEETAAIRFHGDLNSAKEDESWGIDNVNVTAHSAGSQEFVGRHQVQGSCETCDDGVQNQNEDGVDSGGVCGLSRASERRQCFPLEECTVTNANCTATCKNLDGTPSCNCPYLVLCFAEGRE